MSKDPQGQGPYEYYERPTENRANIKEATSGKYWGLTILILILILIVLIPITKNFSAKNYHSTEQPKEIQRVKKTVKKNSSNSKSSSNNKKKNTKKKKNKSQSSAKVKTYVVKSNDTLSSIAQENGTSVAALVQLNDLTNSSDIKAGQTLKLN